MLDKMKNAIHNTLLKGVCMPYDQSLDVETFKETKEFEKRALPWEFFPTTTAPKSCNYRGRTWTRTSNGALPSWAADQGRGQGDHPYHDEGRRKDVIKGLP